MNANRVQGGGATLGGREGAKVCWVLSSEQFPPDQLVRFGQKAEQAGFDGVWSSDHWQPWQDNQGHSGQAWVTLSSVGALTNNVFFGTGVTCPTYRYAPAVVAQAFATLGILYPGRVFLGVGSGEAINELAATGQWDEYGIRAARLEEAVQLIRQLWTGEIVNHDGRFYRVNGKLYDVPRVPVPMYIAANGKKSFHTAGMYGDGLITDSESALKPESRQFWEQGAREAGKDPSTMPIGVELFVHVGDEQDARKYVDLWRFTPKAWTKYVNNPDPRDIERQAKQEIPIEEALKSWKIGSDPQVHVAALQQLIDGGVTIIFVHSAQPDQERIIEFYAREVLPKLRR